MGFEHVETDPPADCSCRWRNSAGNAGWDRISTSDGCIRHNPPHQTFGRRLYRSHFATCPAAGAFRYRHETRAERRH